MWWVGRRQGHRPWGRQRGLPTYRTSPTPTELICKVGTMKPLPALLWGVTPTCSPSPGDPGAALPRPPTPRSDQPPACRPCLGHVRWGPQHPRLPSLRGLPRDDSDAAGGGGAQGLRAQGCSSRRIPPWSTAHSSNTVRTDVAPTVYPAPRSLPRVSRSSASEDRLRQQSHASSRSHDPGKDFSTSWAWATSRLCPVCPLRLGMREAQPV